MNKIITGKGIGIVFMAILSFNVWAKETSLTALYKVAKIQKIAKKMDEKCIDNTTTACPRMAYWKVHYQALDLLVPYQEHIVSLDGQLPQVGSIKQLTLALGDK